MCVLCVVQHLYFSEQESRVNTDDPVITWHESGKLYAVNCLSNGRRCYKVYSFPVDLLYEINDCPGLQSPISWRSARNMIFSPKDLDDEKYMAVFENNGQLRHKFLLELNVSLKYLLCFLFSFFVY